MHRASRAARIVALIDIMKRLVLQDRLGQVDPIDHRTHVRQSRHRLVHLLGPVYEDTLLQVEDRLRILLGL